ncbi:MAG TPA: GNAT family N-acetyltransferase [Mycobacteriales bacterium]|jgi:GNAT superfamily N-acetyltransferase|nr:GNAT family N-acetyltransferase [Mycobacteriales bacterium]
MTRRIEVSAGQSRPEEVQRLLRALPDWFGVESAVADYVRAAAELPSYLAYDPCRHVVGALLVKRHFPVSAELYLMAVHPAWHRKGIGRALVETAETQLSLDGVRLLQVKTLGPSRVDENYAGTRAFYAAMGFLPVEELPDLWPGNPCLVMAKALALG